MEKYFRAHGFQSISLMLITMCENQVQGWEHKAMRPSKLHPVVFHPRGEDKMTDLLRLTAVRDTEYQLKLRHSYAEREASELVSLSIQALLKSLHFPN